MVRNKLSKLYIYIAFAIIIFTIFLFKTNFNKDLDEQTKLLCRWYASIDHRKEITDERYEKMSHLWTDFDWYKSCINQVFKMYEK